MIISLRFIIYSIFFSFLFILIVTIKSPAQDVTLLTDSISSENSIDISEVARKSAELTLKTKNLIRQAVDEDEMDRLKTENKQLIHFMDSLLDRETLVKMNTLSSRNLKGKLAYWQQNLQAVTHQQTELSSVFGELDESIKYLEEELALWKKTNELMQENKLGETVHKRFREITQMIDTTRNVLDQKSINILSLLDVIARLEVEIESMINKIKIVLNTKQEDIFITDQAGLFQLNYKNKSKWHIPDSYLSYYSGNFVYLTKYMRNHLGILILHLIFLILLITGFIRINKLKINTDKEVGAVFKKQLILLLANPISAALIIWLFSTVVIYPYRPLLFLDTVRLFVTIPIVIVLINILPKKYHNYAYVFGFLVILHIAFINLPGTHIIARLTLMLISLLAIVSFTHFVIQFRKDGLANKVTSKYILLIGYTLLIISVTSLFANIIGKVAFSISMVEALLGIILVFILVSFSLVVVNGLVVLLIDSKYGDELNIIKHYKTKSKQKITKFFNGAAIIIMIYLILGIFNLQTIFLNWFDEFFLRERNIGSMTFNWGNIFLFFLVIYLSIVIANFIRSFLEEDVLKRVNLKKGLPYTIALMVKYTLVTIGIFIAVSAAGIPTSSFTVILGAFGVGIGFGLQNIFNNLVSGLILLFERPIQIGDTIEVGTLMGNVRSIGIRSSNVRTFDGAEIIVPNGNLISNEVINWTLSDERRRIELMVGVSYDSDPHKVKEVLLKVINNHKDIITDPAPNVFFNNLGDSSLDFRMLFWTKEFNQWIRIKSEIIFQVFDELKAAGIEIPFPQRDLHIRSIDQSIDLKKKES